MKRWNAVLVLFLSVFATACAGADKVSLKVKKVAGPEWENASIDKVVSDVEKEVLDRLNKQWEQVVLKEKERLTRLRKEVFKKWDTFLETDQKIWVDYSDSRDSVSQVDFEKGRVLIAAVVPADQPDAVAQARALLRDSFRKVRSQKAPDGKPVMEEMLPEKSDEEIETVSVSGKPFVGEDGVQRIKLQSEVPMVPNHLQLRAERYRKTVEANAIKRGLEPSLVMAVIHTESAFNPMARSPVPAFGLMQLVPRTAGVEAYEALHGAKEVPTPEYLYDSDNNIELGVLYLARLDQVYFRRIHDVQKRRYVAICAYNAGPTRMRRIIEKLDIEKLRPNELYAHLRNHVPAETRDYLERVENRRDLYKR